LPNRLPLLNSWLLIGRNRVEGYATIVLLLNS
jgi:hypothetical protein